MRPAGLERRLGVRQPLVDPAQVDGEQPAEQPAQPRAQARVGGHAVIGHLVERGPEERLAAGEVEDDAAGHHLRAQRPRREVVEQGVRQRQGGREVAGGGALHHPRERPAHRSADVVGGREARGVAQQVRRQPRCAAPRETERGRLDLGRDDGVRLVRCARPVDGTRVGVRDGVGQRGVQPLRVERVHAAQHRGRDERVGEPQHEVVLHRDDVRLERGPQGVVEPSQPTGRGEHP